MHRTFVRICSCIAALSCAGRAVSMPANVFTQEESSAIEAMLDANLSGTNSAMVIGLVDENGNQVFGAGNLDNGTTHRVDGDSVFFLGSVSKTFTALLLLEMVERGEVEINDPVADYLPESVRLPTHGGKKITLLHLATHASGLPMNPDNMKGADEREHYEAYSIEMMYEFLSNYELGREPGAAFQYSNVGMALLGHALERRAGKPFETLVVERICQPLGMNDTRITLTPEMESRRAMGHDSSGGHSPPWCFHVYHPVGDIHSTANDLLKYVAAHAGLNESALRPLMEDSHVIRYQDQLGIPNLGRSALMGSTAMDWVDRGALQPKGMKLLGHAGGAGSYHAWVGFDKQQRRGVVVFTTSNDVSVEAIGWTILQRLPLTEQRMHSFARELVGIGVALEMVQEPPALRITKVLPASPSANAGLQSGLIILKIDDVSTADKSLSDSVALIRGPLGTKVRLLVLNPKDQSVSEVELTRSRFVT